MIECLVMMGTTSGGYPTISTGYTRAAVRLASSSARKRGSPPMLFCSPPSTHALGSVPDDDLVDRSPRRRREVVAFDLVTLRDACPCATCRSLRDQGATLWPRPGSPLPLRIENAELHGAWGLAVTWNDGHSTGIFPFESLRRWREGDNAFGPDSGLG